MTTADRQRCYAVLIGVDFSPNGDLALERAFDVSGSQGMAHVHVVHVHNLAAWASDDADPVPGSELDALSHQLLSHVQGVLERWCATHYRSAPFLQLSTHVRSAPPADAIAQLATDLEADLVVVGTHGRRGARRLLLGSVAEKVVRLSPCAVLVVPPPAEPVPQIEPACARCLETRRSTDGAEFWCEQHRERHGRRHTFHYRTVPGGHHSSLLIHP